MPEYHGIGVNAFISFLLTGQLNHLANLGSLYIVADDRDHKYVYQYSTNVTVIYIY